MDNSYLNYRFDKLVAEAKARMLLDELGVWTSRVEQFYRDEQERLNRMSIAQRVRERRSTQK